MKSTRGTRTLTIGELRIKIMGVDLAAQEVDRALATEFNVAVDYEIIGLDIEVKKVRASADVHFDGGNGFSSTALRGTDLYSLFSGSQISALEGRILDGIRAGVADD